MAKWTLALKIAMLLGLVGMLGCGGSPLRADLEPARFDVKEPIRVDGRLDDWKQYAGQVAKVQPGGDGVLASFIYDDEYLYGLVSAYPDELVSMTFSGEEKEVRLFFSHYGGKPRLASSVHPDFTKFAGALDVEAFDPEDQMREERYPWTAEFALSWQVFTLSGEPPEKLRIEVYQLRLDRPRGVVTLKGE